MSKRKMIKKAMPKVLSAAMSLTVLCCTVGMTAYSAGVEQAGGAQQTAEASSKTTDTAKSVKDTKRFSKEETVYVIADADGTPQKVIVSDWIKNPGKAKKITDKSNLTDIETTKGDETYTINEQKMVEWGADGNDIYYKGNSNEQLPVGVAIKYELDGKAVAPKELAGKSGKLKITFTYTNRQFENVNIGGKKEKIYVPFVMLTGMVLDNEKFSNVNVSNGKVINDGTHTIVAGFALPGVQESLGIDDKKLKLPSTVEITADVTDFELATTLTVASNDMFNGIDTTELDGKADELKKKIDKMSDGMKQLTDGSSKLYDGISTLLDKSGELIDGVNKLYSGAEQLKNGAGDLKNGAAQLDDGAAQLNSGVASLNSGANDLDDGAAQLSNGAYAVDEGVEQLQGYIGTLSGGLSEISSNSEQLKGGAKQVFDTLLSTAGTQIAAAGLPAQDLTIGNYNAVLQGLTAQLDDSAVRKLAYDTALKTVSATVNSQRDVIRTAVEAEVKKQVTNGVLAAAGLGLDSDSYEAAVAAGQISEAVQQQIAAGVTSQMANMDGTIETQTDAQVQSLIETNMQGEEVQSQINAALEKAAAGRASLQALETQLDSYNTFYQGVISYTEGVDRANAGAQQILGGTVTLKDGTGDLAYGASQLKDGTGTLAGGAYQLKNGSGDLKNGTAQLRDGTLALDNGALELFNGIGTLKNGTDTLLDGVRQLKDGSMQLDEGLKKFKKEGVDVIVDAVNGDLKNLRDRFKAMLQVSENYKSFSGIADDTDGKVDFIFKTDSISPAKNEDE